MDKILRLALDRVEGEFCLCQDIETEEMYRYKKNSLPAGAVEGDILIWENGALRVDRELTQTRKEEIRNLMRDLWE